MAGNVQRLQSCLYANTGSRVGEMDRGCQPSHREVNVAAPLISGLVPWEKFQSWSGEGHCFLTRNDVWLFFPKQTSFTRPVTTTFPHKPHLTCVPSAAMAAASLLQHHCSTCAQGAGGRGRGHRGRASPGAPQAGAVCPPKLPSRL